MPKIPFQFYTRNTGQAYAPGSNQTGNWPGAIAGFIPFALAWCALIKSFDFDGEDTQNSTRRKTLRGVAVIGFVISGLILFTGVPENEDPGASFRGSVPPYIPSRPPGN